MSANRQQATSYTRFNSINTQPIVPDCLTIDFVNTTWKVDVALRSEPRETDHFTFIFLSQAAWNKV